MSGTVVIVLFLAFTIGVWITYHKIFTVYYFSLSKGLMRELLTSMFLGMILTALTLYFWWVAAVILLLVGLGLSGKPGNPAGKKAIMVVCIIAAVVVSIVGIRYKAQMKENADTSAEYERIGNVKDDQAVDTAQMIAEFTDGNIDNGAEDYSHQFVQEKFAEESVQKNDSDELMQEENPNAVGEEDVFIPDYSAAFVGTWIDTANMYQMEISLEGDTYFITITIEDDEFNCRVWYLESTSGEVDAAGNLFYSGVYVDLYPLEDGTVVGGENPCDTWGVITFRDRNGGMLEWVSNAGELPAVVQFTKY